MTSLEDFPARSRPWDYVRDIRNYIVGHRTKVAWLIGVTGLGAALSEFIKHNASTIIQRVISSIAKYMGL